MLLEQLCFLAVLPIAMCSTEDISISDLNCVQCDVDDIQIAVNWIEDKICSAESPESNSTMCRLILTADDDA